MLLLFLGLLGALCGPRRKNDESHGTQTLLSVTQGLSVTPQVAQSVRTAGSQHEGPAQRCHPLRGGQGPSMELWPAFSSGCCALPRMVGQHWARTASRPAPCGSAESCARVAKSSLPLMGLCCNEDKSPTAPQRAWNEISTQDPFESMSFLT